jgi:hypothetical protein
VSGRGVRWWTITVAAAATVAIPRFIFQCGGLRLQQGAEWITSSLYVSYAGFVAPLVTAVVLLIAGGYGGKQSRGWKWCDNRWWRTAATMLGSASVSMGVSSLFIVPTTQKDTILAVTFGIFAIAATVVTIWVAFRAEETLHEIDGAVGRLEDATRRSLKGLDQIFARAYWMLTKADGELWYVNFLFGFGSVHEGNPQVEGEYLEYAKGVDVPQKQFRAAVEDFRDLLRLKISGQIKSIRVLVLEPTELKERVLVPLSKKPGYTELDLDAMVSREAQCRQDHIATAWTQAGGRDAKKLQIYQAKNIPMQILITRIKGADGSDSKCGCLVFLVGTENVAETGTPMGFYTELEHVVKLYKGFAQGLMASAQCLSAPGDLGPSSSGV